MDELNNLNYKEFFNSMNLSKKQREERVRFAEIFEDLFFQELSMIYAMRVAGAVISFADFRTNLKNNYIGIMETLNISDAELEKHASDFADNVANTTEKEIDSDYTLSYERAFNISSNESNTVYDHIDFNRAVKSGKTRKRWKDIVDDRERKTHYEVGGTDIPINEMFSVGNCKMLHPHDFVNGTAEELINCRCTIQYF